MRKDENINLNDPLFLVSRGLDGDLSASEQIRLDELLAASAELRVEAEELKSVSRLLESRRTADAQIDWKLHERLVLAEITESEAGLGNVDTLLKKWGRQAPEYDERALAEGVMARIAPAGDRKRLAWRVVARLGAPLAAAAAVVLAVTATWFGPMTEISMVPVIVVQIGPAHTAVQPVALVSIVSFARPAENDTTANESLTFGYMTLGSSPIGQTGEEAPL